MRLSSHKAQCQALHCAPGRTRLNETLTAWVPSLLTCASSLASSSAVQSALLTEGRSWCVHCFQHSSADRPAGPILAISSHAAESNPSMFLSTPAYTCILVTDES